MANNKKISEFPLTSLSSNDIFLINHLNTTSTVTFDTLSSTISQNISTNIVSNLTGDNIVQKLSTVFIKKPTTATDGQILTYNGSNWVASNVPTFSGFGSGYLTGIFLSAGTNMTFMAPNNIKQLEIIAVGSAGNGASTSTNSGITITSVGVVLGTALCPNIINNTYQGGNGGGGFKASGAGGGGAGGWVKKTLTVTSGQIFTYSTGIINGNSIISSNGWSMSAYAGSQPAYANGTIGSTNPGGAGGSIGGDYDIGHIGENGSSTTRGEGFTNPGGNGALGRDIYGNLGGENSKYSGYIFVKLI